MDALRLLLFTGTLALCSSCTHTTRLDPVGPAEAWAAAQESLAGRQARVTTVDGHDVSIRDVVLTSTAVTGKTASELAPLAVPFSGVRSIEYRSRRRGAVDWLLIGLAVNAAGLAAIMSDEGVSDPEWALAAFVVLYSTIPYVVVGTIRGSTIRFQVRPGA